MIRLSRMADYGVVLMTQLARQPRDLTTAAELAAATSLPTPTVSKLLKLLAQDGLLTSQRGIRGGYALARPATAISVAEIVHALDGPIALTECTSEQHTNCEIEALCPTRTNWRRINDAIRAALGGVTLAEMASPFDTRLARPVRAGALSPLAAE
ncbi:MAG: SUF system Fe-S cluster assembly regulator [Alphaproteobacteria bacterium]|nr:SUF system Fe-S cluster assembly regulator [Alphaproteobacteria bacterium]